MDMRFIMREKKIEIDVLMPDHVVYIYALYMHGN
jgi:hypothetical protein